MRPKFCWVDTLLVSSLDLSIIFSGALIWHCTGFHSQRVRLQWILKNNDQFLVRLLGFQKIARKEIFSSPLIMSQRYSQSQEMRSAPALQRLFRPVAPLAVGIFRKYISLNCTAGKLWLNVWGRRLYELRCQLFLKWNTNMREEL